MSAPATAAVRFVLMGGEGTPEEHRAFMKDERHAEDILADHIRSVAAEMRKESEEWYAASMKHGGNQAMTDHASSLEKFADKLEATS